MSKESIKRFIDWNKKVFADDEPFAQYYFESDGEGNEQYQLKVGKSMFGYKSTVKRVGKKQESDMIDVTERRRLENDK